MSGWDELVLEFRSGTGVKPSRGLRFRLWPNGIPEIDGLRFAYVTGCVSPSLTAICLFFLLFRNHIATNDTTSNPAIPPTTPPIIAVFLELDDDDDDEDMEDIGWCVCVVDVKGDEVDVPNPGKLATVVVVV